jgi:hypothetical protein
MKAVLALLILGFLFPRLVLAQDRGAVAAFEAARGPKDEKCDVKVDEKHHPNAQPDASKAIVYVVQDLSQSDCLTKCLTTKVGIDGAWVGANADTSYIFYYAQPGEHHLCVNWQARFQKLSRQYSLAKFVAEPGKTYYFRVRLLGWSEGKYLDLDTVNSDQGEYLIALLPYSVCHPKK